MLTLSPRVDGMGRVALDAEVLPFGSGTFAAVTAFLFDPFARSVFFAESFRVLQTGGVFFGTLPHHRWGTTLRRLRNAREDAATFITNDGRSVQKPSYLFHEIDLQRILNTEGFESIQLHSLRLPTTEPRVSPDVVDPAAALGLSPYELPIIQLIMAKKP
jgi:hypothetical protein